MSSHAHAEVPLVEQPAIGLLAALGCLVELTGGKGISQNQLA